jgi:hypothetical protein
MRGKGVVAEKVTIGGKQELMCWPSSEVVESGLQNVIRNRQFGKCNFNDFRWLGIIRENPESFLTGSNQSRVHRAAFPFLM